MHFPLVREISGSYFLNHAVFMLHFKIHLVKPFKTYWRWNYQFILILLLIFKQKSSIAAQLKTITNISAKSGKCMV